MIHKVVQKKQDNSSKSSGHGTIQMSRIEASISLQHSFPENEKTEVDAESTETSLSHLNWGVDQSSAWGWSLYQALLFENGIAFKWPPDPEKNISTHN